MYQRKADVNMLNAVKSVLADFRALALCQSKAICSDGSLLWQRANTQKSANTLFTAFSISLSTLSWYIVRLSTMPTQTKTSSHRD